MAQYSQVQIARLYEKIVQQIESQILNGELHYGDRLPTERELAEQFGVSRTAVREAVKALQEKGLVTSHPGRGTFITNGASRAVRDSLGFMIKAGSSQGSDNLVEAREILEPGIAALAAQRATEQDIALLRQSLQTMDAALEDADAFIEADLEFHLALAHATQNPLISALIDPIVGLLREHRKQIFLVHGAPRGQQHHKRIFQAVVAHDADAARQAMRDHLDQVRKDVEVATATLH